LPTRVARGAAREGVIGKADLEFELEFEDRGGAARVIHLHRGCQAIWDSERRPRREVWTPVQRAVPAIGATVEARLTLGLGRSIILSVMRAADDEGSIVWLNVTSGAPLPATWRPVEWRSRAEAPDL
jgi:hypothetical protein